MLENGRVIVLTMDEEKFQKFSGKKSREAKVLEELKNLARARIEEIRVNYESDASLLPEADSAMPSSGMLPQIGSGMVPSVMSETPSPNTYDSSGILGDICTPFQWGGGKPGSLIDTSPTRPNILDGLNKTSDVLTETEKSRYLPATERLAGPTLIDRTGKNWPQPRKHLENVEESPGKRDGIPRPPPPSREKSPGKREIPSKRDGIPKPPSQEQRDTHEQTGAGDSGRRTQPSFDREFSQESENSALDSPLSDLSGLTWSGTKRNFSRNKQQILCY